MFFLSAKQASFRTVFDMTEKFYIAIDCDGVIFCYESFMRDTLIHGFGVDPDSIPEQTDWSFSTWPIIGEGRDGFLKVHTAAVDQFDMFENINLIQGASEALWNIENQFGKHVEFSILTHRLSLLPNGHRRVISQTMEALQRPAPGNFSKPRIPFHHFMCLGGSSSAASKLMVYADTYIDDSPSNVEAFAAAGRDVICFDQAYNKSVTVGERGYGWTHIEALLTARISAWLDAQ